MKKNLVPLFGIAFVVALIATGLFYGLVVSRSSATEPGEPVSQPAAEQLRSETLGIPAGMRAVSVQVGDSSGVLEMLRPGHKVDIQAVSTRSQDVELKTILENIEVLKVNRQPEPSPGRPSLPVVTVLATPAEAEIAALADAAARVRLVLRNPEDQTKTNQAGVTLSALLRKPRAVAAARPRPAAPPKETGLCREPATSPVAPLE